METAKIKNFILIVLVLANVFLLVIFGVEKSREFEVERQAYAQLQELYEKAGISLPGSLSVMEKAPVSRGLSRSLEAERMMLEKVLGKCTVIEERGNIYAYIGTNGQAKLRGTGEFDMLLGYGVANGSDGKEKCARELLEKMGFECGSYVHEEVNGEQTTITLNCVFEGNDVYNARISCLFSGNNLMIVEGKRFFDTDVETAHSETIDAGTALVRFLKESVEKGIVCTSVTDISAGYNMSVTVSGDCILSPVWYINTDAGSHVLNAETGKMEIITY